MTKRLNRLAVGICGAGHSGSTLLGLVLGAHPDCFYAGEAKKTRFIGDESRPLRKRVCKICGPDCPVWSRYAGAEPDLYEALARLADRPVVIDSTKKVEWIRARAAELADAGVPHKLVFLTRDGRAVINSRARKYRDRTPEEIVQRWIGQIEATEALVAERQEDTLRVRYEELATDPEATVPRICAFLELPFEQDMLHYEQVAQHPLGGNTGTQSVLARARGVESELAKVPQRSEEYYRDLSGGFTLDLRWREELDEELLRVFEDRAGAVNEAFRWEASQ